MSAKNMISVYKRLCKEVTLRFFTMRGDAFALLLYILTTLRAEVM